MYSFILRFGISGSVMRRFRVSISWRMMRSSSDLDRDSPIDLIRSRNSLEWEEDEERFWVDIASSRPRVFSCSIFGDRIWG